MIRRAQVLPGLLSSVIEVDVGGNLEHPRHRPLDMIEVPGVARCAQEGLLGQVLSLVLIAAAPLQEGQHRGP